MTKAAAKEIKNRMRAATGVKRQLKACQEPDHIRLARPRIKSEHNSVSCMRLQMPTIQYEWLFKRGGTCGKKESSDSTTSVTQQATPMAEIEIGKV